MDRELVEAAQNRDREAYADLIRVRGDRLYALANRILRDVDRAEDALQEALVIVRRGLDAFDEPSRFDDLVAQAMPIVKSFEFHLAAP